MNFWVIIPARYASTRFPGKPLSLIGKHPMLWYVYQHALESGAEKVVIATDDERIYRTAQDFGATVCMTASTHHSGTDRVAEAAQQLHAKSDTIIVNVQGDEPLLPATLIRQAAEALAHHHYADVATLCEPIISKEDIFDPNIVKVVYDKQGFALYFSRAPIPWLREEFKGHTPLLKSHLHARHIGIYAYRAAYLNHCTQLPIATLEQAEALEQLRILVNGGKIYIDQASLSPGIGVDTPEDLEKVQRLMVN